MRGWFGTVSGRPDSLASTLVRGRHGFDGGKDSWDACRAPSPRKSGGTQRNCEHAARSRRLISGDVHPELACRAGLDVIKAGWSARAAPTRGDEMIRD